MTEHSGTLHGITFQAENQTALIGFLAAGSESFVNSDTVSQVEAREVPTPEQIRAWKQRELNRMFHGQKKELAPLGKSTLETSNQPIAVLTLPSQPVHHQSQDWFVVVALLSVILFATVRHTFGNYLPALFQSIFNYSTASRMFRERNISLYQGELRLEIFSYIVFGLLIYQASHQFNFYLPFHEILQFFVWLVVAVVYFFGKKIIYLVAGFLFENVAETSEFVYNFSNHIKVIGIISLPFSAAIAWAPVNSAHPLFISGLTIITFIYILLLWRGTKIFIKKQFSIFYLFLYLCTLEILPLALVIKLISG